MSLNSRVEHLLERIPETGYYVFLNPKTGAPYQLRKFYYLNKRISDRLVCRGWPPGTCSVSAWRWGYDAERDYIFRWQEVYDKN